MKNSEIFLHFTLKPKHSFRLALQNHVLLPADHFMAHHKMMGLNYFNEL